MRGVNNQPRLTWAARDGQARDPVAFGGACADRFDAAGGQCRVLKGPILLLSGRIRRWLVC
jgi:hypothetical protein